MGRCLVAGAGWGTLFGVSLPIVLIALSPGNALVGWEEVRFFSTALYRPSPVTGLKIKGKDILLREIAHAIESLDMPARIREDLPDLTDAEWAAASRMITMIMLSLEHARPG
jgi:hypothetical protein